MDKSLQEHVEERMTDDMHNYHTSDLLATMSASQLEAAWHAIEVNIEEMRVLCEGTLIDMDTFRMIERSERRKQHAIRQRLQTLNTQYDTMTTCATCGVDMYVRDAVGAVGDGWHCRECYGERHE